MTECRLTSDMTTFIIFNCRSNTRNEFNLSSLKTEKWEDRDGNKKQITRVIGSKLIRLGERKKKEAREHAGPLPSLLDEAKP